jgi:hypothetical protein
MDLLSSRPAVPELPPAGYHSVSIHGTLPRRKKGAPVQGPARSWDMYSHMGTLPHPARARLPTSPLIHNIIEEHQPYHTGMEGHTSYRYSHTHLLCSSAIISFVNFTESESKTNIYVLSNKTIRVRSLKPLKYFADFQLLPPP